MKLSRDIQTVSELKQNASKLIKQVNETGQPIILTLNGKPAAVIQDVESYERMAEAADYRLTVRDLREAQDHVDKGGELIPAEDIYNKLSKKLRIDLEQPVAERRDHTAS